jgi:hypothetical protein
MQAALLVSALAVLTLLPIAQAQESSTTPVFRVDSSLTLVDVIAENRKTGLRTRELLTTLKREDFRIFDNGREMPIESFDIGAANTTRPIALWLIVQCDQKKPLGFNSMFMRGKTQFLKPALEHLGANDSIGVAHWCDDGNAELDLLPEHDSDAALAKVEEVLSEKPITGKNRPGELAMQGMIRMVLKNTHETVPQRLPIFLFLYGDHCATYVDEANSIVTDLLETSGMVYGINDGTWSFDPHRMMPAIGVGPGAGQISYLVHYYSGETGGEVYSTVDPKLYSAALDYILTQLHLRYTIGFKPLDLDGKRHSLTVQLTQEARKRFPSAELRFRPEYVPVANR